MTENDYWPTILVVERGRVLTERLEEQFGERYRVLTAHSGREAMELHDAPVLITFVEEELRDQSIAECIKPDLAGRIVLVSSNGRGVEIGATDDYHLQNLVSGNDIDETVEHLVKQSIYEDEIRQWLNLLSRKATLESELNASELSSSREYQVLMKRIEMRRKRASESRDEIPGDRFDAVFRESNPAVSR